MKFFIFNLVSLLALTSCGTIIHGTRQCVGISSNPSNASVWVDRKYAGNTPIAILMSRKDHHIVRIELEGYQCQEIVFTRQVSGWVCGNVVFGGVIGLAIDAVSGGLYRLTPEQIQVELIANEMSYCQQTEDSYISIVVNPDPSWEKIGNLTTFADRAHG